MIIRRATFEDLPDLFRLYTFLNPTDPILDPASPAIRKHWKAIIESRPLRYFVAEMEGIVVSTCNLTLIPNLTRGLCPYGVIENVVTDPSHRKKGLGTAVLQSALEEAWREGCYKVMLSAGSKRESTLLFYEKAGFQRGVKTSFVAYPPPTAHRP